MFFIDFDRNCYNHILLFWTTGGFYVPEGTFRLIYIDTTSEKCKFRSEILLHSIMWSSKKPFLKLLTYVVVGRLNELYLTFCNESRGVVKKWNESGFRPPLCTYRLSWARRTSWGWRDDWNDTVLQTHDSKFEPCRSEAEHTTSRSRRLPTNLTFTRGWGRNIFCFFQTAETGNRTPNSGVKGSGTNHHPRAHALEV